MSDTLRALSRIVNSGGGMPVPGRRPRRKVPHPSDQSRKQGFQRALRQQRLRVPRRSAPRPPY